MQSSSVKAVFLQKLMRERVILSELVPCMTHPWTIRVVLLGHVEGELREFDVKRTVDAVRVLMVNKLERLSPEQVRRSRVAAYYLGKWEAARDFELGVWRSDEEVLKLFGDRVRPHHFLSSFSEFCRNDPDAKTTLVYALHHADYQTHLGDPRTAWFLRGYQRYRKAGDTPH